MTPPTRKIKHRLRRQRAPGQATLRNIAISVLHLAGITEITRSLQRISRDQTRARLVIPL